MADRELTFGEDEFIVSKTDLSGRITYGNGLFVDISGYSESELIGAPHNILRHNDMPALVFKMLWEAIAKGNEIFAYVKNRSKHGDFYWVYAQVTPSFDNSGNIIGYHSVRRKPKSSAVAFIEPVYKQLLAREKAGGIKASAELLDEVLKKGGKCYDEFIFSL